MANKSGIHINPAHKGDFTALAKKHGMSVQAFAAHVKSHPRDFSGHVRKMANFAANAPKFNHGK